MFSKYIQFRNPNPNTNFNLNSKNIISVRVRICGMYLLIMRYWYSYTREIHSPVQYIMHCGDLVSLQFVFGTSIKLQRRIKYNWERGQVATMLSTHNA